MIGNLPQQGIDHIFDCNGFKCAVGVDNNVADGYVRFVMVSENAKGAGSFNTGESSKWKTIHSVMDADIVAKADSKAFVRKFLTDATPALKAHTGFGGNTIPVFPEEIVAQLSWIVKYGITFNPTTCTFTVS
jgi:hypothetical protein